MFSGAVIGIIVAISGGTWIYTKVLRRTGNNVKSSTITALIAAAIIFVVTITVVATIDSMLASK